MEGDEGAHGSYGSIIRNTDGPVISISAGKDNERRHYLGLQRPVPEHRVTQWHKPNPRVFPVCSLSKVLDISTG